MTCADCGAPCEGVRCRSCQRAARAEADYARRKAESPPETTPFVDDRDTDHDPYGVVPDSFLSDWNATSIPDALANAEEAPSSTPHGELRRCSICLSIRLHSKPGWTASPVKRDEPLKCGNCGAHIDSPKPPREQQMPGEQATLREVADE